MRAPWINMIITPKSSNLTKISLFHFKPANSHTLGVSLALSSISAVSLVRSVIFPEERQRLVIEPSLVQVGWKLQSHAYGPISLTFLKNVKSYSLNSHTFQKYVNFNQCKKQEVRVQWVILSPKSLIFEGPYGALSFLENFRIIWKVLYFRASSEVFGNLQI